MPELPEVETVRRGLEPVMAGARFVRVAAARPDLRFPLPENFAGRLNGALILGLERRGKYLTAPLSTGETLVMHLGMSGRFTIAAAAASSPGAFYHAAPTDPRHDHVTFDLAGADAGAPARVTFNDPRRFGFMDIVPPDRLAQSRHFAGMGPEPLGEDFTADVFSAALKGRAVSIKAALLDQRVLAGVGNIYACEALHRARISPKRRAASVAGLRSVRLHAALRAVLSEAIEAGGSSLRDFAASDGALGYFQHKFRVYDREGLGCGVCGAPVRRLAQAGRSTFYCGVCQR